MSEHAKFTIDTGIQVLLLRPRSPWQRGSNENTNGLLRQYFPKGKSLAGYTRTTLTPSPTNSTDDPTDPRLHDTVTSPRTGVALTG